MESLSQRGRNAFYAGRLNEAIELWERAAKKHPDIYPALAEAYFRRALTATASPNHKRSPEQDRLGESSLHDLQRATELQPNDAIYYYHLGLAHHRRGELDAAQLAYEIAAGLPTPPRGLFFSLALARLETDPNFDPGTLNGLAENERALFDMLAHVLRGDTSFLSPISPGSWVQVLLAKFSGANPTTALVRGLVYLMASQDEAAQKALDSVQGLAPHAQAVRHYYLGVLAARRGDWSKATMDWQQARARGMDTPWLRANLATAYLPAAIAAVRTENWKAAVEHARAALRAQPDSSAAAHVAVTALNHQAQNAAQGGQWTLAATLWREASEIHSKAIKTDSTTRVLLRNLAIAAEHAEAWEQAAGGWRDLLRTKPRSKKTQDHFTEAQWTWIRRRAILDLQKAGQLGQAITLLKQKIKTEPNDTTNRLELVEALLANQQETAAGNELQRILQMEPQNSQARSKLAEWHARREEWHAAEQEMQQLLAHDPANGKARRQMASLMVQRGRSLHSAGRVSAAREVLVQALTYAPDDADIYIDLGRADLDLRRQDAARADFEQAYRVGGKKLATHEQIVRCWTIERQRDQVEKAIARAETDLPAPLDPLFYVHSGLACFSSGSLRSASSSRENQKWENIGKELIERGIALKPSDPDLLRHVVMDCLEGQLLIGVAYAERLTQLTPDDPMAWIAFGFLRALNGQVAEGKQDLKHGGRLARQQGLRELEQAANEMRQQLDNPLLSLISGLGLPLGALIGQAEDQEEYEVDDEELLWTPPRRRRR